MLGKILDEYNEAIFDTDSERALQTIRNAVAGGIPAEDLVLGVVIPSIDRFLSADGVAPASLAQHFLTSQIASDIVDELLPLFKKKPVASAHVVLGAALGDFHGLGKRIVAGCLKAHMIEVTDLGLNVSAERFVDTALDKKAGIIGISSMMMHTARGESGCRKVRQILHERGLEEQIKIIVGGAPYLFDEQLYQQVGADAWAKNGFAATEVIGRLIRGEST